MYCTETQHLFFHHLYSEAGPKLQPHGYNTHHSSICPSPSLPPRFSLPTNTLRRARTRPPPTSSPHYSEPSPHSHLPAPVPDITLGRARYRPHPPTTPLRSPTLRPARSATSRPPPTSSPHYSEAAPHSHLPAPVPDITLGRARYPIPLPPAPTSPPISLLALCHTCTRTNSKSLQPRFPPLTPPLNLLLPSPRSRALTGAHGGSSLVEHLQMRSPVCPSSLRLLLRLVPLAICLPYLFIQLSRTRSPFPTVKTGTALPDPPTPDSIHHTCSVPFSRPPLPPLQASLTACSSLAICRPNLFIQLSCTRSPLPAPCQYRDSCHHPKTPARCLFLVSPLPITGKPAYRTSFLHLFRAPPFERLARSQPYQLRVSTVTAALQHLTGFLHPITTGNLHSLKEMIE